MSSLPLCVEAVIFDLDGTLVATDRFWVAAASAGAQKAFAELGIERELPSPAQWLSIVGVPIERGFRGLFPDLPPAAREQVQAACVAEGERALRAGGAALMPGAHESLTELRSRGVKLGLASNCSGGYLERMLQDLGLSRLVDVARCLDSPGVGSKADMLREVLEIFGTRSAVMVGDRASDAEAARDNALPHVHLRGGFAVADEAIECQAELDDLSQLVPLLERRSERLAQALRRLGALTPAVRTLAISGRSAAGKSLLARDLARLARACGRPASVVPFDAFLRPGAATDGSSALEHVEAAFDGERLLESLVEPWRRREPVQLDGRPLDLPLEGLLIVEGLFLHHPRWRLAFDRSLWLEVEESTTLRRVAGRSGGDPDELLRLRRSFLPTQKAFEEFACPVQRADLVVAADNPLELQLVP